MTNTTVPAFHHLPLAIQQMMFRDWLDSNIVFRDYDISFRVVDYGCQLADGQSAATEFQGTPLCVVGGDGRDMSLVFKSGEVCEFAHGSSSLVGSVESYEYRSIDPCPYTGKHEWKTFGDSIFREHGMRVH